MIGSDNNSHNSLALSRTIKNKTLRVKLIQRKLTSLSSINSILIIGEILQSPDLIQIIFNILNYSRSSIFAQIVHGIQCFENTSPFFWFTQNLAPQMLHDDVVIFPVESMVGEDLKFWICYVPVFIAGCLFQDFFVLGRREKTTLLPNEIKKVVKFTLVNFKRTCFCTYALEAAFTIELIIFFLMYLYDVRKWVRQKKN